MLHTAVAELALNSNLGGFDRVVSFTSSQVYWMYERFMRSQAATRAHGITDLTAILASGFGAKESESVRSATEHFKALHRLAGFPTQGTNP